MKQEKINYSEIINLGFDVEVIDDEVYFNEYGFDYCIITKDLTKKIYLDWSKTTQLCEMIRIDNNKNCHIKSKLRIMNLDHLKEMINFFSN